MPRVIGNTQAAQVRCIKYREFGIKTRGNLCTELGPLVGDITPLCLQAKFSDCHNHRFCLIFFDTFLKNEMFLKYFPSVTKIETKSPFVFK